MYSKKQWADIPFSAAQQYINVNHFGSNIVVRVTDNYIEVDLWGRSIYLPGVKRGLNKASNDSVTRYKDVQDADYASFDDADEIERRSVANAKQHQYRTRMNERKLRLIINQNFDPCVSQFLTVTFADIEIPFLVAEERFKRLLKELQRKYLNMKFVSVIEPHRKEGYHMHTIVNQPLAETVFNVNELVKVGSIKSKKAALPYLWPYGLYHVKSLDNGGNLGASLAKYMTKRGECTELDHKYAWRHSRNLEWYRTLRGYDALEVIRAYDLGGALDEHYSYTCHNLEYVDSIRHYEFCLDPEKVLLYGPRAREGKKIVPAA